ncbi:PH domain-containing protein [Halopiger aswanensis]|uniref:PH (Pleckstrin Homology) domain-containing protein n=1 Tax=Halopiger aswanensis TaxID=148449 RepID=A0A419WQR0_9EURY|nr:PH domain-containing protein [Halopiger aswanensis]RKD97746.1 PH (Pleckstrin Homology) domain-containing protein [Halopiger aswanensis]
MTEEATPDPASERPLEWLVLAADEELHFQTGPRIQTIYPWFALAIVGSLAAVAAVALELVPPLALLSIPAVVAPAAWQYARVTRTTFAVTTHRIATRSGVLGVSVRAVPLECVQNTQRSQHAVGRLVGYGTVTVEIAGGSDLRFWDVDDPAAIQTRLESAREQGRGADPDRSAVADVSGSLEQWEAVLEEVRGWRRTLERSESRSRSN